MWSIVSKSLQTGSGLTSSRPPKLFYFFSKKVVWTALISTKLKLIRIGTAQLKTIQEVITLVVFCGFSVLYLKEELKWNYLVGFGFMIIAVFFVFKKW